MSRDSNTILLRQQYTGEPRQAAHAFYQARGLYFGLVPDATDPAQQLLEAVLLRTLARPHPQIPAPTAAGTFFGLRGVSPDIDTLVLWPHPDQLTQLLGRILPVRTDSGIAGVPGLRARPHPSRTDTLLLARPGHRSHLTLRARPAALQQAEDHILAAGLEPLWSARTSQPGERQAWESLARALPPEETALWSRALRRAGLHTRQAPDWTRSAPESGQLEGPKPQRIAARPVGPAGGPARGIVAVTSARGQAGLGCTTTALTLAGALARTGAKIAFLGADDPNGLHRILEPTTLQPGQWHDLLPDLPGPGTLRGMIVSPSALNAAELLADAARGHDTVVLDAGAAFQLRHLAGHADAAVVLTDLDTEVWGSTEILDRRPAWVQMWDWLNTRYLTARARARDPHSQLLHFLDETFEMYVWDRVSDDNADVYDADDPADTAAWWDDFQPDPDGEGEENEPLSFPEDIDAELLDIWRQDFLAFLAGEGAIRHPDTWGAVAAVWIDHNRNLDLPGSTGDGTLVEEVLREAAPTAIARWGEQTWQEHHPRWAAAGAHTRKDSLTPWQHLIEEAIQPADPAATARFLLAHLNRPDNTPIALAIAHVDNALDNEQHHLAVLRDTLRAEGIPAFTVLPDLHDHPARGETLQFLTHPSDREAAAANRLALVVGDLLANRTRP
ncbi:MULTISPECIES: tyrosine-protein kinase family protein [Streptomyces]|uniref:Tyrosine-protein kinase family protein n=4 Tax=Streptomyces TaxID=1883 RepID=A0ABU4LIN9_9ACTN|nr:MULTISPECIES: tyrosine-protein kinase family protein [Streptomyces]MBZ3908275.1 tyrosine-protein kinase family protein [Streptomyces griseiscabiei]MDX2915687.1 tyrosine-protein kinase family protein [Streptomyces griseiscabiei]